MKKPTYADELWDRSQRKTRVKLCEFESLDAAYPAVMMGADALGFHIFKHHDVEFKVKLFASIFEHLPETSNRTLLTDVDYYVLHEHILPKLHLHTIQLYPDWEPDVIEHIRTDFPHLKILKVMSAQSSENTYDDETFLRRYTPVVDGILLDSFRVGGTGKLADLEHCRRLVERSEKPVFLAGGLTPENVSAVIQKVKPYGVDVETGVSDRIPNGPLIKNLSKCERFLQAVEETDRKMNSIGLAVFEKVTP